MYVTNQELEQIGQMALTDDKLLAMLVDWNETNDWGMQDQILCKIVNYVKQIKDEADKSRTE